MTKENPGTSKKIIVAMCGASGIQYGIEVLRALKDGSIDIQFFVQG